MGLISSAWEWYSAAIEDSQEGRWVRDAVERRVIADITAATNALHGGRMPPFTDDSWYVRLGRIANWAGVLRLAAGVGGWELRPVVGQHPERPAGMAELLSGIYAVGNHGEIWMKQFLTGTVPPERTVARAESFLNGPGSVEDLALFFYDWNSFKASDDRTQLGMTMRHDGALLLLLASCVGAALSVSLIMVKYCSAKVSHRLALVQPFEPSEFVRSIAA
jgi:hypothetical protein